MLLKCYHYLHLIAELEVECANQIRDAKFDLNSFKQTLNTSEPTIELVTKVMLVFMRWQLDSKEIKCFLQWWAKYGAMFPIVGFLAWQILRLVESLVISFFILHIKIL
jgi:hypothetical protein